MKTLIEKYRLWKAQKAAVPPQEPEPNVAPLTGEELVARLNEVCQ